MKSALVALLAKGSFGVSTIVSGDGLLAVMLLGGDGVLAAMLLGGLLSASPSIPKLGNLAADGGIGNGSLMIVAFCSLLLNPTAMCLGFLQSPHHGLPHGLSAYLPPVRGGVIWCIFWTTILLCMS
jgi:hypothetical protein